MKICRLPVLACVLSCQQSDGKKQDECAIPYGQCGGTGWAGPHCCDTGFLCAPQADNEYYSQCVPGYTPDSFCDLGDAVACPGDSGVLCAGNECCPDGSTCPSADADYSACASGKTQDCSPTVGLALQGGGWRAQFAYSGVVAGMLAYLNQQQGETTSFASSGLFDRFETVSSVSGGTWFFSSLAYSESYADLMESIGASPEKAEKLMDKGWTNPVMKAMGVLPSVFQNKYSYAAKLVVEQKIGVGDADSLWMIAFFLSTNATWNAFTSIQLEAGASIGEDVLMGSDVNSFMKDKLWLASHSILLPSLNNSAFLNGNLSTRHHASYRAHSPEVVPPTLPAAYNIKLGSGTDSLPPHRYMAKTALPASLELKFTGVDESNNTFTSACPLGSEDFSRGVGGRTPVADVTSASSACVGTLSVNGGLWDPAIAALGNPTPWFTDTANGGSLYDGSNLVLDLKSSHGITQESIDNLASQQLHGLVDGGQTDQLGLANAVAAGSNEVLVMCNHDNDVRTNIWKLLFQGGPPCTDPSCFTTPIFADSSEFVNSALLGLHNLTIPTSATVLTQLVVGTFTTTTVDNLYYGITAGRPITIHVVEPVGTISIGFFEDITRFNLFLSDIVQTLVLEDNAEFVQNTLLPMFVGSVPNGVQVV